MNHAIYGLLAEFDSPQRLAEAAEAARRAGYRRLEAYSPFPIDELHDAADHRPGAIPTLMLFGGLIGAGGAYYLQWYTSVVSYPLNVGGRPLNSWPLNIPITFELAILGAAIAGVVAMLALNGLPRPHHPLFGVPRFDRASRDGFFLCIEANDPRFDRIETEQFLAGLGPRSIDEVPQ